MNLKDLIWDVTGGPVLVDFVEEWLQDKDCLRFGNGAAKGRFIILNWSGWVGRASAGEGAKPPNDIIDMEWIDAEGTSYSRHVATIRGDRVELYGVAIGDAIPDPSFATIALAASPDFFDIIETYLNRLVARSSK